MSMLFSIFHNKDGTIIFNRFLFGPAFFIGGQTKKTKNFVYSFGGTVDVLFDWNAADYYEKYYLGLDSNSVDKYEDRYYNNWYLEVNFIIGIEFRWGYYYIK
jgi:hypothetical protein